MSGSRVFVAVAVVAAGAMLALSGCSQPAEPELTPLVSPPAIKSAGTFTVGIDKDLPPFAGTDAGREAGFDIDVAAALAERLGLTVTFVDVKPSDAATALAQGTADAVMSVPLAEGTSLSSLSLAGSYATDGPAFFIATESTASVEPSLTVDSLSADKVGAQTGSAAYWYLLSELGAESVTPFDTLRGAVEALDRGEIAVIAGDAFVAGYIARDFPTVHFAGQLGPATPLCVAVGPEAVELGDAVREALDALAADGVLDTLRAKWVGELPQLEGPRSEEATPAP